jgi:myo-inositol-1(or 4)-monophosphatase
VWRNASLRERLARLGRAVRGIRSEGAGFSLAYVAAGRADGYWEQSAAPWDVAAGALLVAEAGGRVTDSHGRPHALDQPTIVATNGRLHRKVLGYLGRRSPVRRKTGTR